MRSVFLFLLTLPALASAPQIFPLPREMRVKPGGFALNEQVIIALPTNAAESDRKLARMLMAELTDRFGLAVPLSNGSLKGRRAIVMGSVGNPLVRRLAAEHKLRITAQDPGPEGYVLDIEPDLVVVAGSDDAGAFYGLQSLRQLLARNEIAGASIRDWPYKQFRGVKLYLPGRDNIPYFKRFVRDFMALNKYNKLVLELNAAMRFDSHPEVNAGWLDLARDLFFTRRDRPQGPHNNANSTHHDTADGGILEKDELAELVRFVSDQHIEIIPEIPSLTHSYYLLARHPELAEVPGQWPDTFCPSLPASYKLLFDVMDEYLDVMKPRMVHIGKDEWRMPWGICPRCRNRDYRELFISDVRKIYDHLKSRGIRVAMWGDHLIQPLRGDDLREHTGVSGWKYRAPGAITPEQARTLIPKDILIFNWFWDENYARAGQGEADDLMLEQWGFQQVYGNMTPGVQNYGRRSARKSVLGGAPSSWAATTEFNFGKDLLFSYLGCANMLWSTTWPEHAQLNSIVQARVEDFRRRLPVVPAPSELDPVSPIALSGSAPAGTVPASEMRTGHISSGRMVFDARAPLAVGVEGAKPAEWPLAGEPIAIGDDVSSIIFLHAAARRANNLQAYRYIYNFDDSADLLGWYEVAYEDGFVITVPVRYRVNILEYGRMRQPRSANYCYGADAVDLTADPARPVTFYAFEWRNPRLGKRIREVRLKGTSGFKQGRDVISSNGILLAGVSVVRKRPFPPTEVPK